MLGGTHPYSGPASAYASIGKGAIAYFSYVNDNGGVNGRKIEYKDLDDGYSPPQSVQLTRQLVDQDHIFAMFNQLGTPVNVATRPYLNQNQVPDVYVATGATMWGTEGDKFRGRSAGSQFAVGIDRLRPLSAQRASAGQDRRPLPERRLRCGLPDRSQEGLGAHADLLVKSVSYEVSDPDVTSQVANLKASGADTFFIFATPKFAAQALIAAGGQSWHPQIFLNNVSASQTVLDAAVKAAGTGAVDGVITTRLQGSGR